MTPITIAFRDILYYGKAPRLETLQSAVGFDIVFLILGFLVFEHLKKKFAEEL